MTNSGWQGGQDLFIPLKTPFSKLGLRVVGQERGSLGLGVKGLLNNRVLSALRGFRICFGGRLRLGFVFV